MSFWKYLTGYKQGYKQGCADGGRAYEASLEERKIYVEERRIDAEKWLQRMEDQLQKERNEWEETKAQYVLEQLRLIKGG